MAHCYFTGFDPDHGQIDRHISNLSRIISHAPSLEEHVKPTVPDVVTALPSRGRCRESYKTGARSSLRRSKYKAARRRSGQSFRRYLSAGQLVKTGYSRGAP
ncbi:hypothetical protein EVAR_28291_1 [Eumeta japonica]|uniref:Uncharacterized protein n=1 Tax=Eumeta variegata TaxID=151549 RepID=A0A4C1VAV1_EUMVA|nr:hypothetical protein EVAR_28291_1 [Eumeta japonica]